MNPRRFTSVSPLVLFVLVLSCMVSFAQVGGDDISGMVYIEGDVNDVTWDDDGIKLWDAIGNVYLRYTTDDGRVFELWGNELTYERRTDNGRPVEWVSVEGGAKLTYGLNMLVSERIEGILDPLDLDIEDAIELKTEDFDLSCDLLTLTLTGNIAGTEISRYTADIVGEAIVSMQRVAGYQPREEPKQFDLAIPLPIDVNPEFEILTLTVNGGEVNFSDEEFISASFPNGAVGETDTNYFISVLTLDMYGLTKIIGNSCQIEGPDINMKCRDMRFYPDDRLLVLTGDVVLRSDDGSLAVDSLTIHYDEDGISRLNAVGNVILDFSIFLTDDALVVDAPASTEHEGGDETE
jgi:hypothetical protein